MVILSPTGGWLSRLVRAIIGWLNWMVIVVSVTTSVASAGGTVR